jgi:hypothetical protein
MTFIFMATPFHICRFFKQWLPEVRVYETSCKARFEKPDRHGSPAKPTVENYGIPKVSYALRKSL